MLDQFQLICNQSVVTPTQGSFWRGEPRAAQSTSEAMPDASNESLVCCVQIQRLKKVMCRSGRIWNLATINPKAHRFYLWCISQLVWGWFLN